MLIFSTPPNKREQGQTGGYNRSTVNKSIFYSPNYKFFTGALNGRNINSIGLGDRSYLDNLHSPLEEYLPAS